MFKKHFTGILVTWIVTVNALSPQITAWKRDEAGILRKVGGCLWLSLTDHVVPFFMSYFQGGEYWFEGLGWALLVFIGVGLCIALYFLHAQGEMADVVKCNAFPICLAGAISSIAWWTGIWGKVESFFLAVSVWLLGFALVRLVKGIWALDGCSLGKKCLLVPVYLLFIGEVFCVGAFVGIIVAGIVVGLIAICGAMGSGIGGKKSKSEASLPSRRCITLEDGTELEEYGANWYSKTDHHIYRQNFDGTFTRND